MFMKIPYIFLNNKSPIVVNGVGSVIAHTLQEIRDNYNEYNTYVTMLSLTPLTYFQNIKKNDLNWYLNLPKEQKEAMTMWFLLQGDSDLRGIFQEAFNFFLVEKVEYIESCKSFIVYKIDNDTTTPVGAINESTFCDIVDVILQRCCVNTEREKEFKGSSKAKKIWDKLQEGIKNQNKKNKTNEKYSLDNIISAVSAKSYTLNILNIWDLTIYQLYDQFQRLQISDVHEIQKHSVSVWGDKDNKFDITEWFSYFIKQ